MTTSNCCGARLSLHPVSAGDRCGCTSFTVKPGRPYGPRSRKWKLAMEDWTLALNLRVFPVVARYRPR